MLIRTQKFYMIVTAQNLKVESNKWFKYFKHLHIYTHPREYLLVYVFETNEIQLFYAVHWHYLFFHEKKSTD